MIQRIQSLLLLGVALLLAINLFVPIWTNKELGAKIEVTAFSITKAPEALKKSNSSLFEQKIDSYYIGSLMIASIGLALYTLFLYNNRPKQLMYCNLLTVLTLIIIGTYFIAIPAAKALMLKANEGSYEIGYFIPLLASILTIGARYFIRKDEELVKDSNRMR